MRASTISILLLAASLLSGCASSFEKPPADAYYGEPPSKYETSIPEFFSNILKDPYSAHYKFSGPFKAYWNQGLLYGGKVAGKGYIVIAQINAKNSMGGYTGFEPYTVYFNGETITGWERGAAGSYGLVHIISGPDASASTSKPDKAQRAPSNNISAPLAKDQWKEQQLQQLQQETGLSYEEYQRRYKTIMGQ